jgi:short-subunit dehydrogenase
VPTVLITGASRGIGVRRVIAGLTQKDSGLFFRHDGQPAPW